MPLPAYTHRNYIAYGGPIISVDFNDPSFTEGSYADVYISVPILLSSPATNDVTGRINMRSEIRGNILSYRTAYTRTVN